MARIDKDLALRMMQGGDSDSKIANRFGTSRQAVNLLRKSFVREGTLQVSPAAASAAHAVTSPHSHTGQTPQETPDTDVQEPQPASPTYPTYEQIGDWVIQLIEEASEAGKLRQENAVLRQRADGLLAEVLRLRGQLQQAEEKTSAAAAKSTKYETTLQESQLPRPGSVQTPDPRC